MTRPGEEHSVGLGPVVAAAGAIAALVASGLAWTVGFGGGAPMAGLVALLLTAALLLRGRPVSGRLALGLGALTVAGLVAAQASAGQPVAAGCAMALACFMTSLSRAGGEGSRTVGLILGSAYFLPAAIGPVDGIGTGESALLGLIGVGFAIPAALVAGPAIRRRREAATGSRVDPGSAVSAAFAMREDLGRFGPNTRIGVSYAVPLGILMGLFQIDGSQNVFWVMLTVFLVYTPDRLKTRAKASQRVTGTILAALAVGVLAQFVPVTPLLVASGAFLVIGIWFYERNYALYAAAITCLIVAKHGAADGDFVGWAALRVIDTLIGVGVALAATLVLPAGKSAK